MKRVLVIFFLFGATTLFGQLVKPDDPVKITFLPVKNAKAGEVVEAKLQLEIKKDWHVFSEKPGLEGIRPSALTFEPSNAFTVEKITFPEAKTEYSEIFEKKMNFYENRATVTVLLRLKSGVKGQIPVTGEFKYQACSSNLCLPPNKQKVEGSLTVTG